MLNNACLMGRLVADPELRYTTTALPLTRFTVAVPRSFSKAGAERKTDFIDAVAWRTTAEFICKYFKKGQLIAIEGSIQTDTYEDKNGIKRKRFEISVNNAHFAESKKDSVESTAETSEKNYSEYDNSASGIVENTSIDEIELQSTNDLPF